MTELVTEICDRICD